MSEILYFEDLIKKEESLFFKKTWEKIDKTYKLIYHIQGLMYNNFYYPNLKFIFWVKNKKKLTLLENVITFLYSQSCEYKTEKIEENIEETFNTILNFIAEEETNIILSKFIIGGTKKFNKEIRKNNINDFIQTIKWNPHKVKTCKETWFNFDLITNNKIYKFNIKSRNNKWLLDYNDKVYELYNLDELPEKIIKLIYEIN